MKISDTMQNIVKSIPRRVNAWERRRFMYDAPLFEIWKTIDRLPDSTPFERTSAVRICLALIYHYVPEEDRETASEEIIKMLPWMLAWLRIKHIAGLESRAQGEKRRKAAEKAWKNGEDIPPSDF